MGWMIPIIAAANRKPMRSASNEGCLDAIGCYYLCIIGGALILIALKGMGVI